MIRFNVPTNVRIRNEFFSEPVDLLERRMERAEAIREVRHAIFEWLYRDASCGEAQINEPSV